MKRLFYLLLSFIACLCLWTSPVLAQEVLPEVANSLEAKVLRLSFDDLPAFESGGFMLGYRDTIFQVEGQEGVDNYDQQIEGYQPPYDPAREWIAGQFPSEVIKMGDLMYSGAGIEQLTMDGIGQLTGIDIENFQLANVPFLQDFTLSDLVGDVPFLGDYALADIPNLADKIGGTGSEDMLSQYLADNPDIAQMSVGDSELGSLQVWDVPNLGATKMGEMPEVGDDVVANVPGLSAAQFGSFPGLEMVGGLIPIAKQDISFGAKEYSGGKATPKPVSGGTNGTEGWEPIGCVGGCAHIELYDSDISPIKGAWAGSNWMTNKHRVQDGFGVLGAVFNEAGAYRVPFGPTFALQVRGTDEATGAADWGLAFRVCKRSPIDLGCTAYFMEVPLPITTHEGATILTGVKDGLGGSTQPIKAPDGWEDLRPAMPTELRNTLGAYTPSSGRSQYGLCGKGPHGIDYEALGDAYETIESAGAGGYNAVGVQVGDGRALGRYQYMSYRDDVKEVFRRRGGGAVLDRLEAGGNISQAELQQYFSSEEQNIVFRRDQEYMIGLAVERDGASGSRIIERLGQMHFGGPNSPIDYSSSDQLGVLSGKAYGEKLAKAYKQAVAEGDSACGKSLGKLINPVPSGYTVTSPFGNRIHPVTGDLKFHSGIDLAAAKGTAIVAADGGTVVYAGVAGGYGNLVEIEHEDGSKTWYGHLESIGVKAGDPIGQGHQLGTMGSTGVSTGDHLDFGIVAPDGTILDPATIISF